MGVVGGAVRWSLEVAVAASGRRVLSLVPLRCKPVIGAHI